MTSYLDLSQLYRDRGLLLPGQVAGAALEPYIDNFIRAKHAANLKQTTLAYYRRVLVEFSQFAAWPLAPAHIREYLSFKRKSGLKEVSVKSLFHAVRAFLYWCEREELLAKNPLDKIDRPRNRRTLPKVAPLEAMRRLIGVIEAELAKDKLANKFRFLAIRDHALIRLAYDTGARESELAGLLWADLDLLRQEISIQDGKGGHDRKVFFGRKCKAALEAWEKVRPPDGERLFVNVKGQAITRTGIYQALQKWCTRAGVNLSVHQIRHTYATHSLRRGIDLGHIQHQLGHADISTTAIYLWADDEGRREAHNNNAPGEAI